MTIIHTVLFEFKPQVSPERVKQVCDDLLSLERRCLHKETKKPYVKAHGGGKDNSPEGLQGGLTHGFVFEFANAEDRDYYIYKDPAHLGFVKDVTPLVASVRVVDFTPGEF